MHKLFQILPLLAMTAFTPPLHPEVIKRESEIESALAKLVIFLSTTTRLNVMQIDEHVQRLLNSGYPLTRERIEQITDALASGEISGEDALSVIGLLSDSVFRERTAAEAFDELHAAELAMRDALANLDEPEPPAFEIEARAKTGKSTMPIEHVVAKSTRPPSFAQRARGLRRRAQNVKR